MCGGGEEEARVQFIPENLNKESETPKKELQVNSVLQFVDIKILYFVMSGLICTHRQQELRCEDSEDY